MVDGQVAVARTAVVNVEAATGEPDEEPDLTHRSATIRRFAHDESTAL
jgi:hypothetical protein